MHADPLRTLDRGLRSIHFEPGLSLEAEVLRRVASRRLEPVSGRSFPLAWIGMGVLLAVLGLLINCFWVALLDLGVTKADLARIYLA